MPPENANKASVGLCKSHVATRPSAPKRMGLRGQITPTVDLHGERSILRVSMPPFRFSNRALKALLAVVTLSAIVAPASSANADFLEGLKGQLESALSSGNMALAIGIVFLAGIGTSLTPCVYPMIAITVSVFGAKQVATRAEGAKLSTAFVLGIAALFTPLGVIVALSSDGVFGEQLSSPWIVIPLVLLFVAMAASMFGAFELNLPPALQNRLAQMGGVGVRGAFVLGLVSSLIAAPCTGPVLLLLLGWIATTRDIWFGALAMFAYAIGLGLLTWIVGTFAVSLPKSGRWLEWVKSVFGLVMLVTAAYYISSLIPGAREAALHTTTFLLASLGIIVLGIALGAVHLSFHHTPIGERVRKGLGIVVATAGMCGVIGYMLALPPGAKIEWREDYAAARAQAQRERLPMLVDFGASWCGACGDLDRNTFSDPRVVREGQRFVAVRVDLSPDKDTPEKRAVLRSYNGRGLPLVVLHSSDGREAERLETFEEPADFLARMRRVN